MDRKLIIGARLESTDTETYSLLQLVLRSALTCGGLHGWAGDGCSILGYSAGVRFRGAGCWWGGWWVQQSPRFSLSKWMGENLLPMIGNLSSYSSILVLNSPMKQKYICRWDCVLSFFPHTTSCPKLYMLSKYFLNRCTRFWVSVQPDLNSLSFILDSILWFEVLGY